MAELLNKKFDRENFAAEMSRMLRPVRAEFAMTQDEMATVLGISKKTLVETEKGRRRLGWTESVCMASIFSQSHIIQNALGGDVSDMLQAIAFSNIHVSYPDTMGGKVWWRTIREDSGYVIQQNIISQHYRLLNSEDQRIISSFSLEEVEECMNDILSAK